MFPISLRRSSEQLLYWSKARKIVSEGGIDQDVDAHTPFLSGTFKTQVKVGRDAKCLGHPVIVEFLRSSHALNIITFV